MALSTCSTRLGSLQYNLYCLRDNGKSPARCYNLSNRRNYFFVRKQYYSKLYVIKVVNLLKKFSSNSAMFGVSKCRDKNVGDTIVSLLIID